MSLLQPVLASPYVSLLPSVQRRPPLLRCSGPFAMVLLKERDEYAFRCEADDDDDAYALRFVGCQGRQEDSQRLATRRDDRVSESMRFLIDEFRERLRP